jgi:hypothetical protein
LGSIDEKNIVNKGLFDLAKSLVEQGELTRKEKKNSKFNPNSSPYPL